MGAAQIVSPSLCDLGRYPHTGKQLMQYRFNWEIYDKESGNTFRKERFYNQPRRAFAAFNWARTEDRCVSAEISRRGAAEHSWVVLASFVNRPLQAAIRWGRKNSA
jgi:hypothetical protein